MLLRWNVLNLLSCPAYVVHVSLPHSNVDRHMCLHRQLGAAVRRARDEAAFPILLSISVFNERLSVMMEPRPVGELADSIEFVVVNANDRWCLCILSQDIRLLQTDGQSEVLTGL